MIYFRTKNPNFDIFWKALERKILFILFPSGIFYGYMVYFVVIWDILLSFSDIPPLSWYSVPRKNLATLLGGF
jgi:hypothetical protein